MNGDMECLLMSGMYMMPSYEDTCTFNCDMGYELTGSDTRKYLHDFKDIIKNYNI